MRWRRWKHRVRERKRWKLGEYIVKILFHFYDIEVLRSSSRSRSSIARALTLRFSFPLRRTERKRFFWKIRFSRVEKCDWRLFSCSVRSRRVSCKVSACGLVFRRISQEKSRKIADGKLNFQFFFNFSPKNFFSPKAKSGKLGQIIIIPVAALALKLANLCCN